MVQKSKCGYAFERYSYPARWVSYYCQLDEIIKTNALSVLEVGIGDQVVGNYLRNNTKIVYSSLDHNADLHPDIVGSADNIPAASASFDTVCAFEVLEHLPFEKFEVCLREMSRVSRRNVLLSLPHFGPMLKLNVKIPFFPEMRIKYKIPGPFKHVFNGEHYWEIGKANFSYGVILSILKKYFVVAKDYIPHGSDYHHFFVLEKRSCQVLPELLSENLSYVRN